MQMVGVEKTVFISYRRTNWPYAVAVAQDLTAHGFDVFIDYKSINTGDFEQIIFNAIESRAHFIVLLTPSALERCQQPDDWIRREMEHALKHRRNMVPIVFEGFDFKELAEQLPPHLAEPMQKYNALRVYADYFEAAMERLRADFLSRPLDTILHPKTTLTADYERSQAATVATAPAITTETLSAQAYFERGSQHEQAGRFQAAYADYTQAIALQNANPFAYTNRGNVLSALGQRTAAIDDYTEAIRQDPEMLLAYNNRGVLYLATGELEAALRDYNLVIKLDPHFLKAYNNRGVLHFQMKNYAAALQDFERVLELDPHHDAARHSIEKIQRLL